jgi:hypothetical protein
MGGLPSGAGALVGKRLGEYEMLALLALGGTAEIYLARVGGTAWRDVNHPKKRSMQSKK